MKASVTNLKQEKKELAAEGERLQQKLDQAVAEASTLQQNSLKASTEMMGQLKQLEAQH